MDHQFVCTSSETIGNINRSELDPTNFANEKLCVLFKILEIGIKAEPCPTWLANLEDGAKMFVKFQVLWLSKPVIYEVTEANINCPFTTPP